MTVLISFVLHDAVVMVADGRTSNAFDILTDDAIKWNNLQPSISFGRCGVFDEKMGSTQAITELSKSKAISAEEWSSDIRKAVITAVSDLLNEISRRGEDANERIQVGVAAAGYDAKGYFITATQFGYSMDAEKFHLERGVIGQVRFLVAGGLKADHLKRHLISELQKIDASPANRITSKSFHRQLARTAARTIRYAALTDSAVGGNIRFTIKRQGQPDFSGLID